MDKKEYKKKNKPKKPKIITKKQQENILEDSDYYELDRALLKFYKKKNK